MDKYILYIELEGHVVRCFTRLVACMSKDLKFMTNPPKLNTVLAYSFPIIISFKPNHSDNFRYIANQEYLSYCVLLKSVM